MFIAHAVHRIDLIVLSFLNSGDHTHAITQMMIALTVLGGWGMLGLVPLLARPRSRRFAASLTVVLLAATTLVFFLKRVFGRVRPCYSVPGVRALWDSPTDYSFPSGHTTGSFTLVAFLVTLAWRCGPRPPIGSMGTVVLALLAMGIGISRIYLGVHFPSDVLGSALLGVALGIGGAVLCRPALLANALSQDLNRSCSLKAETR
jgi:undecaprenyl-diphosphatase